METNKRPKTNLQGHYWHSYTLDEFGIDHPYDNYEIQICSDCMYNHPFEEDRYWVDNYTETCDIIYDFEEIKKSVLKTLDYDCSTSTITGDEKID